MEKPKCSTERLPAILRTYKNFAPTEDITTRWLILEAI
jgi:hypothetical protein